MADPITYVDVANSKSSFDGTDIIVVQDKSASSSGASSSQKYNAMQKTTIGQLKQYMKSGLTKSDITDFAHTHTKSEVTDFAHTHTKSEVTDFAHTHTKSAITDFPTTFTMTATLANGTTKTLTIYGSEA